MLNIYFRDKRTNLMFYTVFTYLRSNTQDRHWSVITTFFVKWDISCMFQFIWEYSSSDGLINPVCQRIGQFLSSVSQKSRCLSDGGIS